MNAENQIKILQQVYAGVLADAVSQMGKEGVLDKVTARKREEQLATGAAKAAKMGITSPENVFLGLSEIFACANWTISRKEKGFTAEAKACLLCGFSKKMNSPSPCNLYCLDPMEGMVKGLDDSAEFIVEETLWQSRACRVSVRQKS